MGCGSTGATASVDGGTLGAGGIGASCTDGSQCRTGLSCNAGKCAATGSASLGASCTVGDECPSGACGPSRTCVAAGTGAVDAGCRGDADCAKGLRCAFDGTSIYPTCQPEGSGDVGAACTASSGCLEGLACIGGSCEPVSDAGAPGSMPYGIPPYVPTPGATPWSGATCPTPKSSGPITALFTVSRASGGAHSDGDFFALPWPNDAARDGSGHVDYSSFPHRVNPALGFDAVGRYMDLLGDEPFGGYATSYFRFDGPFDFGSVNVDPSKGAVQAILVDLTAGPTFGAHLAINVFVTNGRNRYICDNYIAIRPGFARPFSPGGTYAAILQKGITAAADHSPAQSAPDFQALLASSPPADAALASAYAAYAPLRKYLAMTSSAPADTLAANVFTVGDVRRFAAALPAAVAAAPAPTASGWVKCDAGVTSPCPQASGARGCQAADPAFDELHALVTLPTFQSGKPPYLSSPDGAVSLDASGKLSAVGSTQVCLALTVPKGAAPATGWPLAIYAHGTGGSFRSHAVDGTSAALSNITLASGATTGFAVLGIDQVEHGTRRGSSTSSPNDLFFNFGNPQAARGNTLQGAADQHALVRLAKSLAASGIDKAVTGTAIALDASHLVFRGHSQGSTEGAPFLAYDATVQGTVLSGASASLIDALLSKTSPVDIKDTLYLALEEPSPAAVDANHPVLSMMQTWIDPADALYFAARDVVVPKAGAGGADFVRSVFQPYGQGDTFTPKPVQFAFAFTGGLGLLGPELDPTGAMPLSMVSGNVAGGAATAAFKQYAPSGYDGHFVAFQNPTAASDVAKFLAQVARGAVPSL
jgi:hypothetical protein